MALSDKKYERMFSTTGSDADKIETKDFNEIKSDFDDNSYIDNVGQFKLLGPVIYQIQLLTEELDALRSEISANKDKVSMTLGTTGSTALAGNTNIVTIGSSTTIAFGDMITTSGGKGGKNTYSIVMTVTNGGVSKTITLTLV